MLANVHPEAWNWGELREVISLKVMLLENQHDLQLLNLY
jgi:hypothetical protein